MTNHQAVQERIAAQHASGLPAAYDDVMFTNEPLMPADAALCSQGSHYDYQSQTWIDGHDHAHFVSSDESRPLLFCGSDAVTCIGVSSYTF